MSKFHAVAFAAALMIAPVSSFAGDGDKAEKPKEEPKPVVTTETTTTTTTTTSSGETYEEERKGNKFTRFFTHTVGGTIGDGLKKTPKIVGQKND